MNGWSGVRWKERNREEEPEENSDGWRREWQGTSREEDDMEDLPAAAHPHFLLLYFFFLRRAIGGHDQQMGMWRGRKEQEGQLQRERDGGDKGGDGWRAGGGTEAWRAASDGAARAEKQRE